MDCAPGLAERNVAQDAGEASQPVGSVGEQHIAEAQLERIAGLKSPTKVDHLVMKFAADFRTAAAVLTSTFPL